MLLNDNERHIFNRLYDDYFYHRNSQYWQREAMKKLPRLVEATRMLVCAEDLGMIPTCVPTVMEDLRILSLEVQSMPKEYGLQFGIPERYPYRSVCTIDSHDMPTLRMWWDEDKTRAQRYYSQMLGRRDEAPHPLPAWLARDIMLRNLQSASMLCILSLQDWLAISDELKLADASAERINIPANPHHYWRYRMHINIDDMLSNHRFCDDVAEMIKQSGR
jgi:4-alpha-glucanotransferase